MRRGLCILLALLAAHTAWASPARVTIAGWPGAEREGEALVQAAARAPRDSVALAAALTRLVARLQDDGWLDARARGAWSAGDAAELAITVMPGVRAKFASIAIEGAREDSAAYASRLGLRAGEWASPSALANAIERAVRAENAAGYAWAQLGVSGWSADSGRVRVRLSGVRGPRVMITEARIDGLVSTRRDVAQRALGKLTGRPYDPEAARAATQRLSELGVFSRIEYAGLAGGGDWQQGVLRWRVLEPRYNSFEGAVGVQGAGTVTGLAKLELGDLAGTARAVGLSWQSRGKGLVDFSAHYAEPLVLGLPLRIEGALAQQLQDTLYTRFRYGAKALTALGGGQRFEAGYEEERVVQPHGLVQEADLQNTTFALERDQRDDAVTPRRGTRVRVGASEIFKRETLRATDTAPAGKRRARASSAEARFDWHRRTGARSGIALESRAEARFSDERVRPDWERYPVGGAASLRGHDEDEFKADRYVLTRLEYRWFLDDRGARALLFWDHAAMQTREALPGTLPDADAGDVLVRRQADGLGFGLRVPAAGGLVDLDYGLAPGRGFLDGRIHLQLVTSF